VFVFRGRGAVLSVSEEGGTPSTNHTQSSMGGRAVAGSGPPTQKATKPHPTTTRERGSSEKPASTAALAQTHVVVACVHPRQRVERRADACWHLSKKMAQSAWT